MARKSANPPGASAMPNPTAGDSPAALAARAAAERAAAGEGLARGTSAEGASTRALAALAAQSLEGDDRRTAMTAAALAKDMADHLRFTAMQDPCIQEPRALYMALSRAVRDRLVVRWLATRAAYKQQDVKRAYYLSAEYLLGRALGHNLINLGLYAEAQAVVAERGLDLATLLEEEHDPGLGNGGLGRLAACFLDSMATLGLPGFGYGIRYDYGIFEQSIEHGQQVERGDDWLRDGNPWEQPRYSKTVTVCFYGRADERVDAQGRFVTEWVDATHVLGVPYDLPVAGYHTHTVNTLRLWSAKAAKEFNLELFNAGDYRRAVEAQALTESISKVLYPSDHSPEGRELRLKQQYFFVACSLHDIIRRFRENHPGGDPRAFDVFPDKAHVQLNDTHPAIAVAELMRLLVDREGLVWDRAWAITEATLGYTNHTLMPEALERWPVPMFERLLPRHLRIIFEINRRFLRRVHLAWPGDQARLARMSIIEEPGAGGQPDVAQVRMAYLATVGSHKVNGVAALHSDLVRTDLLPDFAALWPQKFCNKTNGVTPRRWVLQANPRLSALITETLEGTGHSEAAAWPAQLERLTALATHADDAGFQARVAAIKRANKVDLADHLRRTLGAQAGASHGLSRPLDPDAIFDVQVKRIHEYKRQLLNLLAIIARYLDIKDQPHGEHQPRVHLFGGKAAPGYAVAKQHIRLINDVAETINDDPAVGDRLRVVFVPNYGVSLAERIIPATDISEQISTAGYEASGTGNMKFAMNGALTVGTLDGANIEIREAVGAEHFFLFGLDAAEVARRLRPGPGETGDDPLAHIAASPMLGRVLDLLATGFFSPDEPGRYAGLVDRLRHADRYLVCADFDDYRRAQAEADAVYGQPGEWARRAVHNIAHSGRFSSDRTIAEYAHDIWGVRPVKVALEPAG